MSKAAAALSFVLVLVVALTVPAVAGDGTRKMTPKPGAAEQSKLPSLQDMLKDLPHDACFGDRYEKDEDLQYGRSLTEEEILRLTRPGPGA